MGKRGPKKKKIDPEIVRKLAALFCSFEEIGDFLGVSRETIRSRVREASPLYDPKIAAAYKEGLASAKTTLRSIQFRIAQKGNPSMAIFLGKQYLGQRIVWDTQDEAALPDRQLHIVVSHVKAAKPQEIVELERRLTGTDDKEK